MKIRQFFFFAVTLLFAFSVTAQNGVTEDWYHNDFSSDKMMGVSADKAYEKLSGKTATKIIVAIIDSGVDEDHEDLKSVMWVNKDEIPGNGIDDDNNGYIDDIHGWNFIGGKDGDVSYDNLEVTRLYRMYTEKYKGVNPTKLSSSQKLDYARYLTIKRELESSRESAKKQLTAYTERQTAVVNGITKMGKQLGKKEITMADLEKVDVSDDTGLGVAKSIATQILSDPEVESITISAFKERATGMFGRALKHFSGQYDYMYNPDFDPRDIVGDDYSDPNQLDYGNNHYEGPDALHGTHVAGIVAADRNNDNPMRGIADNVEIMTIRAVPDGDERDKDVAAAIRYAVDNGASIINMSFGKGYSWNKDIVDEAVKHAAKHDVLLVHAAGNSNQDNDITDNFPNIHYNKRCLFCSKTAKNWIEVGALNFQQGENYVATFSNYGQKNVDLFAPGVQIYSTVPDDEYQYLQGTSMASPVVAGVAAMIRGYFPTLTAEQTKEILMSSVVKLEDKVAKPGTDEVVPFKELSVSGGVVNAAKAVEKAMNTKGKRKNSIGEKLDNSRS